MSDKLILRLDHFAAARHWPKEFTRRYTKHLLFLYDREGGECFMTRLDEFLPQSLNRVTFSEASLSGAGLRLAQLVQADFRNANLRGTDFRGADLYRADLRGANVQHAKFDGANLDGACFTFAINLSMEQIRSAESCEGVQLSGYTAPAPAV